MAEILAVVPEEGVERTEAVSARYLRDAKVPEEHNALPFGFLSRKQKDTTREAGVADANAALQWHIDLSDEKTGSAWVGNVNSTEGETELQQLLEQVPDCTMLIPPEDIASFSIACRGVGYALQVIHHPGRLSTS